jgi:hypothetical protein
MQPRPAGIDSQEYNMELKPSASQNGLSAAKGDRVVPSPKEPYAMPELRSMGDIRIVTLGASPGATESGGSGITRKPSGT